MLAVGQFTGQSATGANPARHRARQPSIGQIAGHALSSIFLDNLGADLERLYQVNRLLQLLPRSSEGAQNDSRRVERRRLRAVSVARPGRSRACATPIACRAASTTCCADKAAPQGTGANLLSYLLFDREFARALMKLGHDDAMARRDELVGFLDGASPGYVPLFPREFN